MKVIISKNKDADFNNEPMRKMWFLYLYKFKTIFKAILKKNKASVEKEKYKKQVEKYERQKTLSDLKSLKEETIRKALNDNRDKIKEYCFFNIDTIKYNRLYKCLSVMSFLMFFIVSAIILFNNHNFILVFTSLFFLLVLISGTSCVKMLAKLKSDIDSGNLSGINVFEGKIYVLKKSTLKIHPYNILKRIIEKKINNIMNNVKVFNKDEFLSELYNIAGKNSVIFYCNLSSDDFFRVIEQTDYIYNEVEKGDWFKSVPIREMNF